MARGDHVCVPRSFYSHHAIDVGDGTVIHYTGTPVEKVAAVIAQTSMDEFARGATVCVRHYRHRYDPERTVGRAMSRLGEQAYWLAGNNCEHFATWCATGRHTSAQTDRAIPVATAGKVAVATAGSTLTVSSAGSVAGLSGPGIMSGLAEIGFGGAVGGLATLAGSAGLGTALVMNSTVLRDNECLGKSERAARHVGRTATVVGAGVATCGGIAAVSAAGSVAGLSGAGIMSGLAAIGGGTAIAGTAVVVAAPVVAAVVTGWGLYKLTRALLPPDPDDGASATTTPTVKRPTLHPAF
jgi:hypothetical protein